MRHGIRPSGTSRLTRRALGFLGFLGLWALLAVFAVVGGLGLSPLQLGLLLGVPALALVVAAVIFLRARAFGRRLLHLALDRGLVLPGEEVEGHLELRLERQRMLRSLTAQAWGGEEVSITVDSGDTSTTYHEEVPLLIQDLVLEPVGSTPWPLSGEGEVAVGPGLYRFRFSLRVPEGAPPAFRGKIARVRYFVRVRADIPGGLDAVRKIKIPVGSRGIPADARPAGPAPSEQGEPGRLSVQLELDHLEVEAGSPLGGSVTVTGLQDKRIQGVRIRLREREWGRAKGHASSSSKTLAKTEISPRGGLGGLVAPFTLQVPARATPSYTGQISSLRHVLRVRVRLAWAQDLKVKEEIRVVSRLP